MFDIFDLGQCSFSICIKNINLINVLLLVNQSPFYSSLDIPTLAQLMEPNSAQFSEIFELIARRHPKHLQHLRILHTVERKFAKTLGIHSVIVIECLCFP